MTDAIEGEVPLGDRTNMVYSGSFVTYGRGSFVVTGIGMETEVGKIASLLKTTSEKKTPLQVNLDQFGQKLSIIILVFCGILFGINVFRGGNIGDAFLFAVALAVAAIPEALSSIVTIVLSFGTQKMAKEHAIIRKLQAVEGLGSVSIICSDKTGTLTQNKMTVEQYYVNETVIPADKIDVKDSEQEKLMYFSILCNDSTNVDGVEIGDPTETALINLGSKLGLDIQKIRGEYPRESENPFDSDRKLMSTKHTIDETPYHGCQRLRLMSLWDVQQASSVEMKCVPLLRKILRKSKHRIRAFQEKGFVFSDSPTRQYLRKKSCLWKMKTI